jgi:hypothetical protein
VILADVVSVCQGIVFGSRIFVSGVRGGCICLLVLAVMAGKARAAQIRRGAG